MSTATIENSSRTRLVKESVTRLRPYVPGKPIEEVKRELGLPEDFTIYKLASNENVLGPSPKAVEAMAKVAADVWLYPDDTCFDLKGELAKFWDLSPDHFIIGNGSDEIIHFLALALLDEGDEVIFADPSFVQYKSAAMSGRLRVSRGSSHRRLSPRFARHARGGQRKHQADFHRQSE